MSSEEDANEQAYIEFLLSNIRCPVCHRRYQTDDILTLDHREDMWLMALSCPECETDGLVLAIVKSEETENGKLTEINVRINSAGGSVFDGVAIYNTLKKHAARITIDIDGLAASIASIVAMAGDEVRAAENSMLMIHDPWLVTSGSAGELRETAELLDKVRGQLLDTYTKRTGADEETISQMMTDETWMTASEAMDIGLIDSVTDEMQMAAHYDLTKFKHPPKNLATISSKVFDSACGLNRDKPPAV